MKLRRHLVYVLPLALFACATLPEIGIDHPAHPEASTAQTAPLSSTLAVENLDMKKMSMDSGNAPAMNHDHGGHATMPDGDKQVTLYTCPMDPEVVQDKPGKCPVCGMRLKPMPVKTDEEGDGHDHDR